ncbi:protein OBERON 3 [Nymphaea colorata]|nr:protein OBERON 3 [Nymphaea colorata]
MIAENGLPKKNSEAEDGKECAEPDGFRDPDNGLNSREGKNGQSGGGSGLKSFEMRFSGEGTSKKMGGMGFQELTFSYMCDGSKVVNDPGMNSGEDLQIGLGKARYKGKEPVADEKLGMDEASGRWVERDFLELGGEGRGFKREGAAGALEGDKKSEKKPKLEATPLDLSLGLPNVSWPISSFDPPRNCDPPAAAAAAAPAPCRTRSSVHSLPPSRASSDDFTASVSYSYSHPFSHNPSCSLRNSTDNFELTVSNGRTFGGGNDQIWHCGEGTNGSVHSRFKPIGEATLHQSGLQNGSVHGEQPSQALVIGSKLENDSLVHKNVENANFSNHGYPSILGQPVKDGFNIYSTNSAERSSFFPLELPARPTKDNRPADLREKPSDMHKVATSSNSRLVKSEGCRNPLFQKSQHRIGDGQNSSRTLTRPERLLNEIVSESVQFMAHIIQELPEEAMESARACLKSLVALPEKREELANLQRRLNRRTDLTPQTLPKCHKFQLDVLVTVKTGVAAYLSSNTRLSTEELVEVFTFSRCRNVNCKNVLPVDDCDCKICSKKGFCSACMCQICLSFDCALNTCSWVGCDVCSHWCHADCGVRLHYIKPGQSPKEPGATEMQFHCLGCGHASELFGFVKEVFTCCAASWGPEILGKELDCVRRIFQGSTDLKGKALHRKAEEMITKLDKKLASASEICSSMLAFLKDGVSELPLSSSAKEIAQPFQSVDASPSAPAAAQVPSHNTSSGLRVDTPRNTYNIDRVLRNETRDEADVQYVMSKKGEFDSLESIVRIKEAEARMFQSRADDARREAESLRKIARAKSTELEDEYTSKLAKLCLQETEERRRKKLEELKLLETSHCDYFNMKMRMEAEIGGLLKRMEATKQQWM